MKVLLTGGSGFIAAHCLDILLAHKHTVVTTVRSAAKGQKILDAHPDVPKGQLSYVIVEDIAKPGAFDEAVKSEPPFDACLHTASPFHHNFDKPTELLEPAVNGTVGILKAIKASAPNIKRVAITSSFAAIVNVQKHPEKYDESVWNPVTYEDGINDRSQTYRASKTLAEKAAWEFIEREKPSFTISTINPPMVYGPIVHYLNNLDSINTSNARFVSLIRGEWKTGLPPSATNIWVDVRDLALAHVRAIEVPEAAGKRFFVTAGPYSNKDIADIVKKNFPEYADKLPAEYKADYPDPMFAIDNARSKDILGLSYTALEKTVVDTITSLKEVGA
ncbi:putative ketoreductase [Phaeomoniella chlamydospora]|uniref:Putative ketoreductase n=1 Tax=Phaeomoniella chlamydospora TaxID=158046 RepID=A0A0G2GXY1_PHACM|nr:putative ketoreductase [Phaeomoniella chlamydospora]